MNDPRTIAKCLQAHRDAYANSTYAQIPLELVDQAVAVIADLYALGLVVEEMGEVAQLIGKSLRFGIDTPGREGATARELLPVEMGDVEAAIHYAARDGIASFSGIIQAREAKKSRLFSPDSLDSAGDRLAPEPRGMR